MFKTILVTIDLNHKESWSHALPMAVDMARMSGGALHAIVVVPDFGEPIVSSHFPKGYRADMLAKAKGELAQLLETQVPADVPVTQHVSTGSVHEKILGAIESTGADLVIMASHAPDRVREFLVGSQADRVVRRSPISVLVARG